MKYFFTFFCLLVLSLSARCQEKESPVTIFGDVLVVRNDVDVAPHFLNGYAGWIDFLKENLNADVAAANKAPTGLYTVLIDFVVDKKGLVRSIRPLSKYGYGMEQEAVRVLALSVWRPGRIKGKPVNSSRTITITFKVESTSKSI